MEGTIDQNKSSPVEFTFVTYNIDGRDHNKDERLRAFLGLISKEPQPDIIVVQEGTRLTYEKLLREMNTLGYKRQLLDIMHTRKTGELIFSKFPIIKGMYIQFKKTSSNRGISCAKLNIEGNEVWVCTSQFDQSTGLYRIQAKDLSSTLRCLGNNGNVIFGGDTRILDYQRDITHPEEWYDTWYESGDDQQYTYDSKTNLLVNPPYRDRPDRVWFRPAFCGESKLECVECKLYGNDTTVAISSHYGVWARFRLS